jgi:hypothetical protein
MSNLLLYWERDRYDHTTISLVREFLHHGFYGSGIEAQVMASLAARMPQLGTPFAPVWDIAKWLLAGWEAGSLLAASPSLSRIIAENSSDAMEAAFKRYESFSRTPMGPRDLSAGFNEQLKARKLYINEPSVTAHQAIIGFDYACWNRVQQLVDLPQMTRTIHAAKEVEPSAN